MATGLSDQITTLLDATVALGGFTSAFVCTNDGLVLAAGSGDAVAEDTAAVVSLFDDVLIRAKRDLGFELVDEVSLLDPKLGRTVIRPVSTDGGAMFFLVLKVPANCVWRRNSNILRKRLLPILQSIAVEADQ